MLLVNRPSQERDTCGQREEIEEDLSLSRFGTMSGHADDSQKAQPGHNNRQDLQLDRLRPDGESQHRSDNGNHGQQQRS